MAEDTPIDNDTDREDPPGQEEDDSDTEAVGDDATSGAVVDEIADSLTDEGFNVFHGREFITVREDGQLAPNSTIVKQYLRDTEGVMLAYNDSNNEIVRSSR